MQFFESVKLNRNRLSQNEEDLLTFIFEHKHELNSLTVRKISEANYTVPNSVIRLCKKLGFSGFTEFKDAYRHALSQQSTIMNMTSLDEQIIKTKQLINEDILQKVIDKIESADQILFFAVGLSRFAAESLHHRLRIVGKMSHTFVDPHIMKHSAKLVGPNDLTFTISVSGSTDTPLHATTIARAAGATTVSITGFSNNPLSKLTDYQFYGMTSETYIDGIDISERLSFHYLTNYILNEYVKKYHL
ncbi:MurR/RpiR family transcriptional regulator [Mesobacillus stamsii]|uniref:DNA-binding MurR/RpiR family transcriptional regulator n=1 Tax=Mesobacillus stamsii TaxID=225347 RepID=A0ABU0FQV8_9BACI|nr:MurR/RpiR family transcriptional regulator [Mesobacillus stamsii]MDQ0412291.1 DNA-binding MurR/RpiR family transcriptional regulator [Mesobacillus stamsii]